MAFSLKEYIKRYYGIAQDEVLESVISFEVYTDLENGNSFDELDVRDWYDEYNRVSVRFDDIVERLGENEITFEEAEKRFKEELLRLEKIDINYFSLYEHNYEHNFDFKTFVGAKARYLADEYSEKMEEWKKEYQLVSDEILEIYNKYSLGQEIFLKVREYLEKKGFDSFSDWVMGMEVEDYENIKEDENAQFCFMKDMQKKYVKSQNMN